MLSLLHREGGPFTLMETELQDRGLAVYPRTKVLFQPTDRTNPHVLCGHLCYVALQLVGQSYRGGVRVFGHITLTAIGAIGGATDHLARWVFHGMPQQSPWTRRTLGALPPSSAV